MKHSVGHEAYSGQPGENDCAFEGEQPESTPFGEEHGRDDADKGERGGDHESDQGKYVEGLVHL